MSESVRREWLRVAKLNNLSVQDDEALESLEAKVQQRAVEIYRKSSRVGERDDER